MSEAAKKGDDLAGFETALRGKRAELGDAKLAERRYLTTIHGREAGGTATR